MHRKRAITLAAAIALAAVLLTSAPSPAHAGGRSACGAAAARSSAQRLIAMVSGQGRNPGGRPGWALAGAGVPLLVGDVEGAPAEYVVPVMDQRGRTVSIVGIDAIDGGWHWYRDYEQAKFPAVSAPEAAARVKKMLRTRGISWDAVPAPEARMARDKRIYWCFEPATPDTTGAYVPVFSDGGVTTGRPARLFDPEETGGPAASGIDADAPAGDATGMKDALAGQQGSNQGGGLPASHDIEGVPYHRQETNWWCGPASLEMVFDYFGPDINQGEIAGVADQGSSYGVYAYELARAAQFSSRSQSVQEASLHGYTARSLGYGMAYAFWENGTALYERRYTDLKSLILQDIPVVALTYYSAAYRSGHFRVVKGYNDSINALIVHDPWYEGQPSGPDVVFNMSEFVDELWTYSDRWAMIAAPWAVSVAKPKTVKANQVFTVRAEVAYQGPASLAGQYAATDATATIDAGGFRILDGEVSRPIAGMGASGSNGTATWTLEALETGDTDGINVTAQGLVSGRTGAYGAYSDLIGGRGSTGLTPGPTTRAWGHDSAGVTSRSATWYLAEGCTNGGFETWVLVQNPDNEATAHVNLTYMTPRGKVEGPRARILPGSRVTFNVADVLPGEWSVSTEVTSDVDVVAERAMYGNGRRLGTESKGVAAPAESWYLAEGCTNGGFETWVLVQNPNDEPARVNLTYMRPTGAVAGPEVNLPANSRMTFNVADVVPREWSVSTKVTSSAPVIAERAMYGNERAWGHDSVGSSETSKTWYLAEGCTNGGFETWVLVQNPNAEPASVKLSYMTEAGQVPGPSVTVPANSRRTFNVGDTVPGDWSVSTMVTAGSGIIAERAVYGNNRTWGHDSVGVTAAARRWYLAEGCTNTGFETWVLVQNPNGQSTQVTLTYMTPAGPVKGPSEVIKARSRKTFNVADTVPWEWEVSTGVVANRPVIAERAMYGDSR